MTSKLRRLLLPLLRAAAKGATPTFRMRSAASQALFLIGKPTAKKTSGRLRREQKRATHKEETDAIYEAVRKRAGGLCECGCGRPFMEYYAREPQLDHWLSGSGRRRQKQAVENTWMLTRICHGDRQRNWPSVAAWNETFARHCAKYGYPALPHIIHTAPAKAGGAP